MSTTSYSAVYTARARSIGGRGGFVRTDASLMLDLAVPGSTQCKMDSTNPEELFACGLAASFGGALEEVARSKRIALQDALVQVDIRLQTHEQGKTLSATLYLTMPGMSHAMAAKVVEEAYTLCPYVRAMRGNVPTAIYINNHTILRAA